MRAAIAVCLVLLIVGAGCAAGPDQAASPGARSDAAAHRGSAGGSASPAEAWFSERAAEAGLTFVHFNGMSGKFYQPEIMAPGVGLFDYDNDGDLDVYLVQGRMLGDGLPLQSPPPDTRHGGRLYRNDLEIAADGARVLRFTDVTSESGLESTSYGMGVATGDIDNDGWIDLYLTGFGGSRMFRNNGDGTFTDITARSRTGNAGAWGVPATFLDFDRDGRLDLFVGNYLSYSLQTHTPCFGLTGVPDYCRPEVYRAQPNRLFRNQGDGTFRDVTLSAGMGAPFGPALGASTADFNGDGWTDLFVANDGQENELWINQRNGTFANAALLAGVALGPAGELKANMGVDAGDFDNDGDEDLIVTELINQGSSLYVNGGSGIFEEQSDRLGVRVPTLRYTGFGIGWVDVDNDGWLDVLSVSGQVNEPAGDFDRENDPFPLGQRNLLLRNLDGRFQDASNRAGPAFRLVEASRGAAFGDIDNDGDTDAVVGNGAGKARLLVNEVGSRSHWIGLRLVLAAAGRDALGARVAISRSSGPTLWRRARADGSYASANDPRVLVGLGQSKERPRVRVIWPSGRTEEWADVVIDRYTTLVEGTGGR